MWYEDHSTAKLGIAYGGPVRSSWTPARWAEHFGRKVINGLIANAPESDVVADARMAARFALIVMGEEREGQEARNAVHRQDAHRELVERAFATVPRVLGGMR